MIEIRRVTNGDEESLAYIQNESWKEAFKDIIPKESLPKYINFERSKEMYKKTIEANRGYGYILIADGTPCLISWWDKTREGNMDGYAELICIHSLPSVWHKGYGSMMMDIVLKDMKNSGYKKAMLWVFDNNYRAISFYKKHGFVTTNIKKSGFDAVEEMFEKEL